MKRSSILVPLLLVLVSIPWLSVTAVAEEAFDPYAENITFLYKELKPISPLIFKPSTAPYAMQLSGDGSILVVAQGDSGFRSLKLIRTNDGNQQSNQLYGTSMYAGSWTVDPAGNLMEIHPGERADREYKILDEKSKSVKDRKFEKRSKSLVYYDMNTADITKVSLLETRKLEWYGQPVFSPNGKFVAQYTPDPKHACVWSMDTGKVVAELVDAEGFTDLAISPDGLTAVSCAPDHLVKIWDLEAGKLLHSKSDHGQEDLIQVKFSPDGKRMVSASKQGKIIVWDTANWREIHSFSVITERSAFVNAVVFTANGKAIICAQDCQHEGNSSWHQDIWIRAVDREKWGERLSIPDQSLESIKALSVSSDGKTLAAMTYGFDKGGDWRHKIYLWKISCESSGPHDALMMSLRAQDALNKGNTGDSEQLIRAAVAADAQSAECQCILGDILNRRMKCADAANACNEAARLDPANADKYKSRVIPAYDGKPGSKIGDTCYNPIDGAIMVWVPEGEFQMGSTQEEVDAVAAMGTKPEYQDSVNYTLQWEIPKHTVYVSGYWMYKYEVTQGQYKAFCDATGKSWPVYIQKIAEDEPMVRIKYSLAKAYAEWAKVDLPTEAQWEKAARGTDGRQYPWGGEWDPSKCNNDLNGYSPITAVGRYPNDVSPYGCMDMASSVMEWCKDYADSNSYAATPAGGWIDPQGPATKSDERIIRGGSYRGDGIMPKAHYYRCAARDSWYDDDADSRWDDGKYDLGFRLAVSYAPQRQPDAAATPGTGPNAAQSAGDQSFGLPLLWKCEDPEGAKFVTFSPDGKYLAYATHTTASIKLVDAKTGKLIRVLSKHANPIVMIRFSSDGKTLVSADERGVKVWSVQTGKQLKHLVPADGWAISNVRISHNGKLIATGLWGGGVRLWDATTGKLLRTLNMPLSSYVDDVQFSADDTILTCANRLCVWRYNIKTGKTVENRDFSGRVWSSSDCTPKTLLCAPDGPETSSVVLEVLGGQEYHLNSPSPDNIRYACASPDRSILAGGSSGGVVRLWSTSTDELLHQFMPDKDYGSASVTFSHDGKAFAAGWTGGSGGAQLCCWEAPKSKK